MRMEAEKKKETDAWVKWSKTRFHFTFLPTISEDKNPCEQSLLTGYGDEEILRWFYDASRKKCLEFTYNGLGGNENNFLSRKNCEESCKGVFFSLN